MEEQIPKINIAWWVPQAEAHSFDSYQSINILNPSTYQIVGDQSEYIKNEFTKSFEDGIPKNDQLRIFIFSEYLKRQFYIDVIHASEGIDCISGRNNSGSIFIDIICKVLDIPDKAKSLILFNSSNYPLPNKRPSLTCYRYIHKLYLILFYYFRKKIRSIKNDKIHEFINIKSAQDIIENFFNNKAFSPYIFENILYSLSEDPFKHRFDSPWGKLIKSIKLCHIDLFYSPYSPIYKKIIDKYHLYLYDLLNISDISRYIPFRDQELPMPHFAFIPIEPSAKYQLDGFINFHLSPIDESKGLWLNIPHNFDTLELAEYIKKNILLAVYRLKEYLSLPYSKNEIIYLSKLIDSKEKRNNTSNYQARLEGLYLWDKIYLYKSKSKISEAILHFITRYKYKGKDRRVLDNYEKQYRRYIQATNNCISSGKYLPLK